MVTATISSKYKVVIPREIREQFSLSPGQKVAFIPYKRTLRVVILPPIAEAFGFLVRGLPGVQYIDKSLTA
jgi:AbrB family looped-hinge helix DNA binding protein